MKRLAVLIGIASLALVLGGCGLLPMVEIGDVLGLEGQSVEVRVEGIAAPVALPLALTPYQGVGSFGPVTFDDVDDVPDILTPNRLSYELGIGTEITVSSDDGVYPETITVTAINAIGTVSEPGRAPATAEANVTGNAVFTRSTLCVDGALSCSYTLDGATLGTLSLNWGGVASIVFGGTEPNSAELTVTVSFESDPGLAPGSTVAFVIEVKSPKAGL